MAMDYLILLKQEWMITLILFVLLFIKLGKDIPNAILLPWINGLLCLNLLSGFLFNKEGILFGEMFMTNARLVMEKNILNLALLLISMQAYNWLLTHKHLIEFYILLLTAMLGMFFMLSSGNLLMFYLGLEMSTIPVAAAVNFDLTRKQSSEAAMKMIISSAFSSCLLLLGISLVYGMSGTLMFSELPRHLSAAPLYILSFVLLFSGFAFKISAVPFHLWTADVYEGAPVSVTAFLSVVSKASVLFVLVSVLYTVFKPLADIWNHILYLLSILTILIGNLFAIRQNNLKRFFAFSSISQVGFILIGLSAGTQAGMTSVIYFLLIYVFSNLAAFGVVSIIGAVADKHTITDYKALYTSNPFLTWVLTIALFSLAGVPPTAGFFGKFFLLMAGTMKGNYGLIIFASLNLVISFYYYLRIVKAMFMDPNEKPIEPIQVAWLPKLALIICIAGILIAGLANNVYSYIFSLCSGL